MAGKERQNESTSYWPPCCLDDGTLATLTQPTPTNQPPLMSIRSTPSAVDDAKVHQRTPSREEIDKAEQQAGTGAGVSVSVIVKGEGGRWMKGNERKMVRLKVV